MKHKPVPLFTCPEDRIALTSRFGSIYDIRCLSCSSNFPYISGYPTFCPECGVKFEGTAKPRNEKYSYAIAEILDRTRANHSPECAFFVRTKWPDQEWSEWVRMPGDFSSCVDSERRDVWKRDLDDAEFRRKRQPGAAQYDTEYKFRYVRYSNPLPLP